MRADERRPLQMRDRDIRIKLDAWIAKEFAHDTTTIVYHELTLPRPSARIDVAVVNGLLTGFEIKSDLDNLLRLPRQVASFGHVFERATLVTTMTHLEKAKNIIPDWWGIMVVRNAGQLCRLKRGRINANVSSEHALHLLSRAELMKIALQEKCNVSRTARKADIAKVISTEVKRPQVMFSIREAMKSR